MLSSSGVRALAWTAAIVVLFYGFAQLYGCAVVLPEGACETSGPGVGRDVATRYDDVV